MGKGAWGAEGKERISIRDLHKLNLNDCFILGLNQSIFCYCHSYPQKVLLVLIVVKNDLKNNQVEMITKVWSKSLKHSEEAV